LTFSTDFNPFSPAVKGFIDNVRTAIDDVNSKQAALGTGIMFYLYHPMIAEVDAQAFTARTSFGVYVCMCVSCVVLRVPC
jgi:hypothetical protein